MNVSKCNRIVLTEDKAVEIFLKKHRMQDYHMGHNQRLKSQSRLVAEQYGVSPKTVRDIWHQKTWARSTIGLDGKAMGTSLKEDIRRQSIQVRIGHLFTFMFHQPAVFTEFSITDSRYRI
jgi:hypothetical protein